VSGLLVLMFGLYVTALRAAPRLPARWTIAAVVAIHVVFLLARRCPTPTSSTTSTTAAWASCIISTRNLSRPVAEPHLDPAYALSNWHHLLSPYGPLFTLLSYALVPLGVVISFWTLKVLLGIASLTMLVLVWRCASLLGGSPPAAVPSSGSIRSCWCGDSGPTATTA
jgi:hypothetical protein